MSSSDSSPVASERGSAVLIVVLVSLVVGMFAMWLTSSAMAELEHTQDQRWDDVTIAGTEAMLERFASKLTIDPAYYLHRVDEAERARRCSDSASSSYNQVVEPGGAWFNGCTTWTYQDPAVNVWFTHPLLVGSETGTTDDVETRVEVTPPNSSTALTITVASRQGGRPAHRVVSAEVKAEALSEFFRVTSEDLSYGSGADISGKVYSGGDLTFDSPSTVHRDIYAEEQIEDPPSTFADGAQGWDSDATTYGDIRDVFPQPLNFDDFWDDLNVVKAAACTGGGICLSQSGTTAWRILPFVQGGVGKLKVWRSTATQSTSCLSQEEWWWVNAQNAAAGWSLYVTAASPGGVFNMPSNGALWANAHVIVGDPSTLATATVKSSLTIYAGTTSSRKNIVINSDITFDAPTSFDTFGLLASDEVIINPNAVVDDAADTLNVSASILAQAAGWQVARSCGDDGSVITPSGSTLNFNGSIATRETGDIAAAFPTRNYLFDQRLEFLRPPFFPLIDDGWSYSDWRELGRPTWAL